MPRRHTISAAGALAATMLAVVPAAAQDATVPGLRGSLSAQDEAQPLESRASRNKTQQNTIGELPSPEGGADAATPAQTPDNLADDPTLLPAVPGPLPPLGGLGDEPAEEVPEVPGLGITTEFGETGLEPPGTEDIACDQPIPPDRHDLDPYVPIGMKLGSFLLFTEAEVGGIFTDNVLGTSFDPKSDQAIEVAPTVRLDSNWSRHFFTAQFAGDRSWYKNFSVEDDRIYQALMRGRLDITRRTHAELEVEKSLTQEGRNSISLTDIAGEQTDVHEKHITAAADHTFNRLTLELSGTVTDYNYDDVAGVFGDIIDPTIPTGIPAVDIRDYREDELKLRGTYELHPDMAAFVEGTLVQEDYKQPISVEGIRRGSSGFTAQTGLEFAMTGRFTGEIGIGWGEQESLDPQLAPIEGVLLNADLIWQPTPITLVEFIARSEVSTSTLVDSLGAVDRFYELSLQHAFWTYLVIGGYVSYEIADYAGSSQVDQRVKEGVTAEYYFNPYMSTYVRYEHTSLFSTDEASDFSHNYVRIGMRFRH